MNGTSPAPSGTKLIDDFLRRELRVGDPKDALEVATALRTRYSVEADRLDQESQGLPVRFAPQLPAPVSIMPATPGASALETQRAADTLQSDFGRLIDEPANRPRRYELQGWQDVILTEWSYGLEAARLAQDPAQRDKTYYGIRKLSEFAQVSRLAALSYEELYRPYRRLATSLDACGNVLRVLMGEALYQSGLSEGGLISATPIADTRTRRDGLVQALRRLSGTVPEEPALGWPDPLVSYSAFLRALEAERSELIVYVREESLVRILDGLVDEASRTSSSSLRELASASLVDVSRLNELQAFIARTAIPVTPAMTAFIDNLQLFLEAFGFAGGPLRTRPAARLIDLAIPVPLAAFGANLVDAPQRVALRALAAWRHVYSAAVDAAFVPPLGVNAGLQNQLDQGLFAVDRAVDYFSQGQGTAAAWGDEENRAGVYLGIVSAALAAGAAVPGILAATPALNAIFVPPIGPIPGPTVLQIAQEWARITANWIDMMQSLSPR